MNIKNLPASLRLSMVKESVKQLIEANDPALYGNHHLDECLLCTGVFNDEGIFHHHRECGIEVLRIFIKDPFMIVDDLTEAGKHFLGKEQK